MPGFLFLEEYFRWVLLNFLEKKLIGRSTPFGSSCSNTAPAPTALTSTSNLKGLLKSGAASRGHDSEEP